MARFARERGLEDRSTLVTAIRRARFLVYRGEARLTSGFEVRAGEAVKKLKLGEEITVSFPWNPLREARVMDGIPPNPASSRRETRCHGRRREAPMTRRADARGSQLSTTGLINTASIATSTVRPSPKRGTCPSHAALRSQ
jgi:hypothetical protein